MISPTPLSPAGSNNPSHSTIRLHTPKGLQHLLWDDPCPFRVKHYPFMSRDTHSPAGAIDPQRHPGPGHPPVPPPADRDPLPTPKAPCSPTLWRRKPQNCLRDGTPPTTGTPLTPPQSRDLPPQGAPAQVNYPPPTARDTPPPYPEGGTVGSWLISPTPDLPTHP